MPFRVKPATNPLGPVTLDLLLSLKPEQEFLGTRVIIVVKEIKMLNRRTNHANKVIAKRGLDVIKGENSENNQMLDLLQIIVKSFKRLRPLTPPGIAATAATDTTDTTDSAKNLLRKAAKIFPKFSPKKGRS